MMALKIAFYSVFSADNWSVKKFLLIIIKYPFVFINIKAIRSFIRQDDKPRIRTDSTPNEATIIEIGVLFFEKTFSHLSLFR